MDFEQVIGRGILVIIIFLGLGWIGYQVLSYDTTPQEQDAECWFCQAGDNNAGVVFCEADALKWNKLCTNLRIDKLREPPQPEQEQPK